MAGNKSFFRHSKKKVSIMISTKNYFKSKRLDEIEIYLCPYRIQCNNIIQYSKNHQ